MIIIITSTNQKNKENIKSESTGLIKYDYNTIIIGTKVKIHSGLPYL